MLQTTLRRKARGAWSWLASTDCITAQLATTTSSPGELAVPVFYITTSSVWTDRLHPASSTRQQQSTTTHFSSPLPSLSRPHFYSSTRTDDDERKNTSTPPPPPPLLPPAPPTWIERFLPPSLLPYAYLSRLEKPIGTWLLLWPCYWSIALAAPPGNIPDLRMLTLFGVGAVLLRGAGCTINDLWDKDLDGKVERTKSRPLPSGAVTPGQAVGWLGGQLTLGLGVLLQLNTYSQALGVASLALVASYPLMKRITGWPQAFLGLTFNWGALLGYAAVQGACDWNVVLPLYCSGVAWTLVYDTIYAHQDKKDDVAAGIKSTALTFGSRNRSYLTAFAALNVAGMAVAGQAAGCGLPFALGLAAGAGQLGWQVATVKFDDAVDCGDKFKSNFWYGGLLFAGIVADRILGSGGGGVI